MKHLSDTIGSTDDSDSIETFDLMLGGTVQIDLFVQPDGKAVGAKRNAKIAPVLGGSIGNMVRTLSGSGLRIAMHTVSHPMFACWIGEETRRSGATPFVQERPDGAFGISIVQHSENGGSEILTQRTKLDHQDFADDTFRENARNSRVVMLGPIASVEDAIPLINLATELSSCVVALAHPDVLAAPAFPAVAGKLRCLIINATEALRLVPGCGDIEIAAQEFRKTTGYQTELVVTDGERPARVWDDKRYCAQPRIVKNLWHDVGCGDVFSAQYAVARFLRGLSPDVALDPALDAVAEYLRAQSANAAGAENSQPDGDDEEINLGEFACVRNRDFARALALRKQRC